MDKEKFEIIKKHLIEDEKPSIFFEENKEILIDTPFQVVYDLQSIMQEKEYHPEGNVWNHVMLVTDRAASLKKYSNDVESLMIAAFLHDVGKKAATRKNKKGRWISYDHDKIGANVVNEILKYYDTNIEEKNKIVNLVKYHMHHLYLAKDLPYGDPENMIKDVDMTNMILLFVSDRLGRGQKNKDEINKEIKTIKDIVSKLEKDYRLNLKYENQVLDSLLL